MTESELAMLKEAINTLMAIDVGLLIIAHRENNKHLFRALTELEKTREHIEVEEEMNNDMDI